MPHPGRRFPVPWTYVEHTESFEVRDASGFSLAYVYFEHPNSVKLAASTRMTKDEARRIAANIAKLPGLLGAKGSQSPVR